MWGLKASHPKGMSVGEPTVPPVYWAVLFSGNKSGITCKRERREGDRRRSDLCDWNTVNIKEERVREEAEWSAGLEAAGRGFWFILSKWPVPKELQRS